MSESMATEVSRPVSFACAGSPMKVANFELHPAELQLLVDGRRADLTVREFELFYVLAERLDRVVQRPVIYELVWHRAMPDRDRSVDVVVRKVRDKLRRVAPGWRYIHTHFGVGYRLAPEPLDQLRSRS
jgi:DNA-binding response OmpR family regulator